MTNRFFWLFVLLSICNLGDLPEQYRISLKIDIDLCKFDGTVEANIKVSDLRINLTLEGYL